MPRYQVTLDGKTFVVEGARPPTEQEARAALAAYDPPKAEPSQAAAPPKASGGAVDALPSIVGTLFSLAGGSKALPTGVALSALGGAAGEGARQVIRSVQGDFRDVPETITGRLTKMGREAVGQAGMEGVGRGAAAAVAPVAKTLYGLAMRPAKALRQKYGTLNLINQGFTDRVMPTAGGTNKAGELVGASKAEATRIAEGNPNTVELGRVLQRASDDQGARMAHEAATAGIEPATAKVADQIGRVQASHPAQVTMGRLLELRRGADDIADPAFKAARMPGGAGRVPAGTDASVARSMANAERGTLDDVLGAPFRAANMRTKTRAGVAQMAKDAADRPNMLTNIVAGGIGAGSAFGSEGGMRDAAERALLFRALLSPTLQAGAGIALPAVAKYGPRAADVATGGEFKNALLRYLMGGQE